MGLLTENNDGNIRGSYLAGPRLSTEQLSGAQNAAKRMRESIFEESGRCFERQYADKYPQLATMFESKDALDQWKAAITVHMIEKTRLHVEQARAAYGEAVVQQSLGQLNARILD